MISKKISQLEKTTQTQNNSRFVTLLVDKTGQKHVNNIEYTNLTNDIFNKIVETSSYLSDVSNVKQSQPILNYIINNANTLTNFHITWNEKLANIFNKFGTDTQITNYINTILNNISTQLSLSVVYEQNKIPVMENILTNVNLSIDNYNENIVNVLNIDNLARLTSINNISNLIANMSNDIYDGELQTYNESHDEPFNALEKIINNGTTIDNLKDFITEDTYNMYIKKNKTLKDYIIDIYNAS